MLADEERGSAWTRVILGLNAREIHLCGNSSAVSIVERMLSTTGESLEVRQYDRLSPLIPSRRTLSESYPGVYLLLLSYLSAELLLVGSTFEF